MSHAGKCNCGAITAKIAGEPMATRQCWCRQCQKASSGGPSNNATFRADEVKFAGELATFGYPAASGNTLTMGFCPKCGTQITAQSSARPQLLTLRIGFLDEPHGLAPTVAIWTSEAPAWAKIDPAMESWPQQPPPPPQPAGG